MELSQYYVIFCGSGESMCKGLRVVEQRTWAGGCNSSHYLSWLVTKLASSTILICAHPTDIYSYLLTCRIDKQSQHCKLHPYKLWSDRKLCLLLLSHARLWMLSTIAHGYCDPNSHTRIGSKTKLYLSDGIKQKGGLVDLV